jgi:hypothetical protein
MKSARLSPPRGAYVARLSAAVALAALGVTLGLGCGGTDKSSGVASAKLPQGTHMALSHEACDDAGKRVDVLDTNGDGKPDIRRVFDGGGHEVCRIADLNHDGRPDLYEYYDGSGAIRRREFCYDDTGVVNAVEYYEGGKLTKREYDTSGQHRIDTWDWFDPAAPIDAKTGRPAHPVRRERDTTGDGVVDQWWTWEGNKVTIATDRNGDGKPDPASVIVLGGGDDAGAPAPGPAPAAADAGLSAVDAGPSAPTAANGGKP